MHSPSWVSEDAILFVTPANFDHQTIALVVEEGRFLKNNVLFRCIEKGVQSALIFVKFQYPDLFRQLSTHRSQKS